MINKYELIVLICSRYRSKEEAKRAICDKLDVNPETVHKWIYGERGIPMDRYTELIEKFDISPLDVFDGQPGLVCFGYRFLAGEDIDTYIGYITGLALMLEKIADDPYSSITFNADEIPIFHFMPFKMLTYFKLYCYSYEMQKGNAFQGIKFEDFVQELEKYSLDSIFDRIAAAYGKIESREIWYDELLHSILYNLRFMDSLFRFGKIDTLALLLDELNALVENFHGQAIRGKKDSCKKFDFFRKPFPGGVGGMLVCTGSQKIVSIKVGTINSMTTEDRVFVEGFEYVLNGIINQSSMLGVGSEIERTRFFCRLFDSIGVLRKELLGN